ncbi:MAG: gluconokinase [Gammaproteobacteria bacterium]
MVITIVGVSGSGKTTVGRLLARNLNWQFFEGDDFHSLANIAKMRAGSPLSDVDRSSWLAAIRAQMQAILAGRQPAVFACSALKRAYRDFLRLDGVQFVYLKGDYELFRRRLECRTGHFFDARLLASQFETLEEPECGLVVDAAQAPAAIVNEVIRRLELCRNDDGPDTRRSWNGESRKPDR